MSKHRIREALSLKDLEQCKHMATAVWGQDSSCSVAQMSVHARNGGVILLAFEDEMAIGFSLSFPALWKGRWVLWSHETAVIDQAIHQGIGYRLKLAQRARADALGYSSIVWTFDPLVSRNAHFNVNKLKAKVADFIPNCYGVMTGDQLNEGVESDRFLALWEWSKGIDGIDRSCDANEKAEQNLGGKSVFAITCTGEQQPVSHRIDEFADTILVEIPGDLKRLPDMLTRVKWVDAMRKAVVTLQAANYRIVQFTYQPSRNVGCYIWGRVE